MATAPNESTPVIIPNHAAATAAAEIIAHRGLDYFHRQLNTIQSGEPVPDRPSAADVKNLRKVAGPREEYTVVRVRADGRYETANGTLLMSVGEAKEVFAPKHTPPKAKKPKAKKAAAPSDAA